MKTTIIAIVGSLSLSAMSFVIGIGVGYASRKPEAPPAVVKSKPLINQTANERAGRVWTRQDFERMVSGMRPEQVHKVLGTADSAVPLKGEFQGLIYNGLTLNPATNEPDKYVMIRFNTETASAAKFYYD